MLPLITTCHDALTIWQHHMPMHLALDHVQLSTVTHFNFYDSEMRQMNITAKSNTSQKINF